MPGTQRHDGTEPSDAPKSPFGREFESKCFGGDWVIAVVRYHCMPPYWQTFLEQNHIAGREFSIPVEVDLSGIGAEIEILDEQGIRAEQTEAYPGIGVSKTGFVPVGVCSIGTGDPYFINARDGEGGPLYRIYHDEVIDESYDPARAIAIVLKDYRELLKYVDT